jgi:RNA polymerase sigma factor (TIGR02999 family)
MAGERKDHTLQATELVNEAFVRLINADVSYQNRAHFYAMAGSMMRRILIDHARSIKREKRGGGVHHITLQESGIKNAAPNVDLLELNAALESLAKQDKRKADILELQFFAGLSCKEIATVMEVSTRTVERDVQMAKAWLHRELHPDRDHS